jgi:endonuclease/exonuclease/phosphatase family metal-dependent hydrolase
MSYNVENLFDTEDDPEVNDEEFLPTGVRSWTPPRYYHKLQQIAKTISAAGEWDSPAIVGLNEIENDSVMTHLLKRTPLRSLPYRYCISKKSDRRGIRVALLYRRDKFRYIGQTSVHVKLPSRKRPTRDILHVWGTVASGDTLDVLVCHFPSKVGGEKKSEPSRMKVAETLRRLCDSLSLCRTEPLIIAMGDFNDTPESACLKYLTATNLCHLSGSSAPGTYKYRGKWEQIDHILIHCRMNSGKASLKAVPQSARPFRPSFLLLNEKRRQGQRPFRTFNGPKYEGGYSDHLPIIADFVVASKN